jgi:hypothetical protein
MSLLGTTETALVGNLLVVEIRQLLAGSADQSNVRYYRVCALVTPFTSVCKY